VYDHLFLRNYSVRWKHSGFGPNSVSRSAE
jgi:hypothetical protein